MVQITLIRHGSAEDKKTGQSDFDRALTDKWCQKLLKLFIRHRESLNTIDTIICSPSLRTRQTCAVLCSIIDVAVEDILYDTGIYMFDNSYYILFDLINTHIYMTKIIFVLLVIIIVYQY